MKKFIIFLTIAVAICVLNSCQSDPINPQIIGTTHLKTEKGIIFAEFDSMRYVPQTVYTGEIEGRDGIRTTVKPVDGMLVTVFTSKIHRKAVFFVGEVTAKEIEAYYHRDWSILTAFGVIILIVAICAVLEAAFSRQTIEIGVINAHED